MMLAKPSRRKLIGSTWAAILGVVIFTLGRITTSGGQTAAGHPKTKEEQAQELLNNQRYSFQDLLNRDKGAVANAEKIFALTTDREVKQKLASILVSQGMKNRVYFDYLTESAKKALENDMPWPFLYDEKGQIDHTAANPAFLEWCRKRGLQPGDMLNAANYEIPTPWYYLAAAGDPRNYDLLIQGLHSHNLLIAAEASRGLAKLQDPRAIDELIATARRVPGARVAIAASLLYFPDPKAQAAADEFMPDKKLLDALRPEIQAKGVKDLFPW